MPQILLHTPPETKSTQASSLTLIEFQGVLAANTVDMSGLDIGLLKVSKETGKVTLRVGLHLLEGKVVKLPRPLAVLERPVPPSSSQSGSNGMTLEDQTMTDSSSKNDAPPPALRVHQFIREKIIFSSRPIPILGSG
ncbi:hypothetical protein BJ684DRAFT_18356 [Piptocephalis cylindrospora]|uniref:Ctf8-domain-containing protein n=1 Tax=Piptocephalis cylindrospora TaxID=1907219 RepID=A0A4P9Y8B3_9FUNG|nr:hypothetical protein BJ684DRAFT_18356 [Piptocephalis cylindrospora]|eukprot:RKP15313.1 hypothetical protein BJ684DRAFT_18356 [Piptocephalis cylindrospora]